MSERTPDRGGIGPEHQYLSTACFHAEADRDPAMHERCRLDCKFCAAPCVCHCHTRTEGGT